MNSDSPIQSEYSLLRDRLAESEAMYRSLIEEQVDAFCRWRPDTTLTYVNQGYCALFNATPEQLLGRRWLDLLPEEIRSHVGAFIEIQVQQPSLHRHDQPIHNAHGEPRWFEWINRPLFGADGRLREYQSVGRDVSSRKMVERKLRLSEERLAALYRLSIRPPDEPEPSMVEALIEESLRLTESVVGYFHLVERAGAEVRLFTWSVSTSAGGSLQVTGKYPVDQAGLWTDALRLKKPTLHNVYPPPGSLAETLPAGHVPIFRHLGIPVFEGEKIVALAGVGNRPTPYDEVDADQLRQFFADAWNLLLGRRRNLDARRLELLFAHSQRVESIGRLAGGMAHDFNNMLSPILLYADALLSEVPEDWIHRQEIFEIKNAAEKAAQLSRQLLTFGRKREVDRKPLDPGSVVEAFTRTILRRTLRENIRIETRVEPGGRRISADIGQFEQILLNLAINAADAMPEGGLFSIEVKNENLKIIEGIGVTSEHGPGEYMLLRVSDTGVGMNPEVRSRIFEPFFTTKEEGRGTGLGLPMVFDIVREYHGFIAVDTVPGQGTTFRLYFPLVTGEKRFSTPVRSTRPGDADNSGSLPRGAEKILVVEDNAAVRILVGRVLGSLGYATRIAMDPVEALAQLEDPGFVPDLLLTDIIMPGMDGRELFRRVDKILPGIRVLFMTGYAGDSPGAATEIEGEVLRKPFKLETLARLVREAIDAPRRALVLKDDELIG